MAEFLTTTDTSASIERIIRGAEKKLMLISAYVYPRMIYLSRLKDAAARGVEITLIFGKKRMDDKVMALFKELDNLEIYYLDILHAKCFVNEKEAVVTSLNLLNGSEEKNREMGVRLNAIADQAAYAECVQEVNSILAEAKLIHSSRGANRSAIKPKANVTVSGPRFPDTGYCIRCRKEDRCDPDVPLCVNDFKVWVQYEDPDYRENYCHTCGEEKRVSVARPMCTDCTKVYASALLAHNAKRKKPGVIKGHSWRAL